MAHDEKISIGVLKRERDLADDWFRTYVVTILCPFDVVFGACFEFGGKFFEGDCCEAEGPEERA